MDYHTAYMDSPIGTLAITGSDAGIRAITFLDTPPVNPELPGDLPGPVQDCLTQLADYFQGSGTAFSVRLDMQGTDFQQRVWRELLVLPFGSTTTYGKIAQTLGDPKTVRAVGTANGQNPIAIIVPCHRVIGASGDLVGYAGGLWRKEWLLAHEGRPVQQRLF